MFTNSIQIKSHNHINHDEEKIAFGQDEYVKRNNDGENIQIKKPLGINKKFV